MQDVNNVIQGSESAFRADEYAQRIQRTRERLSRAGVDVMICLLYTSPSPRDTR